MDDIKMTVDVQGYDHLIRAFSELDKNAMVYLRNAINEGANEIAAKAKQKAPVLEKPTKGRTAGHLRDSIKVKLAKVTTKSGVTKATVVQTEPYGIPVELGHKIVTRRGKIVGVAKARPYMRPAFDESKEGVFYKMVDAMNKALEDFGG